MKMFQVDFSDNTSLTCYAAVDFYAAIIAKRTYPGKTIINVAEVSTNA